LRTKEYLVAVRSREGALALTTMLFHDEVRPTNEIEGGGKKPSKKQIDVAVAIIEGLSAGWDPGRYQDCYRERLKRVIDAKSKRKTIEVPKPEKEPKPVPDLMDALERTLEQLRDGGESRAEEREAKGGRTATRSDGASKSGRKTKSRS
jgi:DNA end-binding protein Ku